MQPGLSYGEALLAPTLLYSPVTEALFRAGITPHYASNITGHGWRKLLRHPKPLRYRVHTLPPVPPVLRFIQQQAQQDDHEAYGTLNMGAGFALFVPADAGAAHGRGGARRRAWRPRWPGVVEAGDKELLIEPLGLRFAADDLQLR